MEVLSSMKRLKPSKRNIQLFKTQIFLFFTSQDPFQPLWSLIRTWVSYQASDPIRGAIALNLSLLITLSLVRIVVRHFFIFYEIRNFLVDIALFDIYFIFFFFNLKFSLVLKLVLFGCPIGVVLFPLPGETDLVMYKWCQATS